ncbi:MAG: hypothetical protein IPJ68_03950 [Candidatus Moraniibacteriota bacterium]|nr:MAG: hypothetical protein IPJ68_03950 [Candidatus Moranbacteria bacterium]
MAAVAVAVLVAMAIIYLTSGGNEGRMTFAKGGMFAALIGLGVVLLAWVTVNFILTLPIINTTTGLIRTGWDTVSCSTTSLSTGAVATTTPTPSTGGGGASGTGGGLGGGGDLVTLPRDTSGAVIVAPIASPASLGVTAPSASSAILSWGAVPGATGYEVERCTGLTCTVFTSPGYVQYHEFYRHHPHSRYQLFLPCPCDHLSWSLNLVECGGSDDGCNPEYKSWDTEHARYSGNAGQSWKSGQSRDTGHPRNCLCRPRFASIFTGQELGE